MKIKKKQSIKLANSFLENYNGSLFEWYWHDIVSLFYKFEWNIENEKDWTLWENKINHIFYNFIYDWFDCVIYWKANTNDWTRCNDLYNYDHHFNIVNSWLDKMHYKFSFSPIEYMSVYGMFITLSHDFATYIENEHNDLYNNIIADE